MSPLICKVQESPIKTEQVMLMTKSNRGFFFSQGEVSDQNWMLCWWQSLTEAFFHQSRGRKSMINDPIWPVFKPVQDFIHVHIFSKCQEHLIKTEGDSYSDDKVKQMLFQQSRGRNSKINDRIWPVFKLVQYFIHVHIISKLQEHQIKTEGIIVMTKSNTGFYSYQGDATLRLIIRSGQFSNLSQISLMSTLSPRFRNIWSKLKEL